MVTVEAGDMSVLYNAGQRDATYHCLWHRGQPVQVVSVHPPSGHPYHRVLYPVHSTAPYAPRTRH